VFAFARIERMSQPGTVAYRQHFALLLWAASLFLTVVHAAEIDPRGGQFIGFSHFANFETTAGPRAREKVLISPIVRARVSWDELVTSWNVEAPEGTYLRMEARALYPGHATKYFTLGLWATDTNRFPRESVAEQRDADGDVSTDTLKLQRPAERFQLRITLGGERLARPTLKFIGVALTDTSSEPAALAPNRAAWGRVLPVPERSQMKYPNGKVLCSPTTVCMLMGFWAQNLHRSELDRDVPQIVDAIYDAKWKGAGNWPFNMAYAGAFRGMRGYVARLSDISELEDWVASGVPVGLSVCYDRLRGKGQGPNGHLVVCVGFTPEGDPIINDPGTSQNVRKTSSRKNLTYAWSYSHNTVYLVYPEDSEIPKDRFGHWASWAAHNRTRFSD
jgi:hypothetical protein